MDERHQPWFDGATGSILLFKVNRRSRPQTLFGLGQPDDVLDHFTEALKFGEKVVTGRKTKRTWLLGNRNIDLDERTVSGQIGWERHDVAPADAYDVDRKQWVDVVEQKGRSARSVFVFNAGTRLLGIVKHPSFTDTVLPKVFTDLLNCGEAEREEVTTAWDVEPILDEKGFREWLARTGAVRQVKFVAKLPNPDGLESFKGLWQRLGRMQASSIEEVIQARDPEVGLKDVDSDPESAEYIAMASHAYGHITATGATSGRVTKYDQRQKVRRVYEVLPATWDGLVRLVKELLKSDKVES